MTKKIFWSHKFDTYKMTGRGSAKMVETLPGKYPADSNQDPDHFEIWKQGEKHYLFCFEIGPSYYGVQIPDGKLDEIRSLSTYDLKGLAMGAIYI